MANSIEGNTKLLNSYIQTLANGGLISGDGQCAQKWGFKWIVIVLTKKISHLFGWNDGNSLQKVAEKVASLIPTFDQRHDGNIPYSTHVVAVHVLIGKQLEVITCKNDLINIVNAALNFQDLTSKYTHFIEVKIHGVKQDWSLGTTADADPKQVSKNKTALLLNLPADEFEDPSIFFGEASIRLKSKSLETCLKEINDHHIQKPHSGLGVKIQTSNGEESRVNVGLKTRIGHLKLMLANHDLQRAEKMKIQVDGWSLENQIPLSILMYKYMTLQVVETA